MISGCHSVIVCFGCMYKVDKMKKLMKSKANNTNTFKNIYFNNSFTNIFP